MKHFTQNSLNLVGALLLTTPMPQALAGEWGQAVLVGQVDSNLLPEASGIAASRLVPQRLYHVNDAGNDAAFVMTDRTGGSGKIVSLDGISTTDTEEIAVGPCPNSGSCVYIADIGDNDFARPEVALYVVPEQTQYGALVRPKFEVTMRYSDGKAHNAESLAIHPDGWIYILTKEIPAKLFRMPLSSIETGRSHGVNSLVLESVGTLDLGDWLKGTDKPKSIVPTSMAMRPDGRQIVILTRAAGVSFDVDLAHDLPADKDLNLNELFTTRGVSGIRLPMIKLPQTEAITYVDEGSAVLYSTEVKDKRSIKDPTRGTNGVPLVRIDTTR